jgi:plasmid stabilization system protein ParE
MSFVRKLADRFAPLLEHPELGPRRDHLAKGLRVLVHRDYAIYYKATEAETSSSVSCPVRAMQEPSPTKRIRDNGYAPASAGRDWPMP